MHGQFWLLAVLAILATFRISYMIAVEDGPGDMFKKLRNLFSPVSFFDKLVECPHCVGVWVSAIVVAGIIIAGYLEPVMAVLWVFAVSGGSTALHLFRPKETDG